MSESSPRCPERCCKLRVDKYKAHQTLRGKECGERYFSRINAFRKPEIQRREEAEERGGGHRRGSK